MNNHNPVIRFVLVTFFLYLSASLLSYYIKTSWRPFNNIELLSECLKKDSAQVAVKAPEKAEEKPVVIEKMASKNFNLYLSAKTITDFNADSAHPSMPALMQKLHQLKTTKKGKVRIAYFGDSMIEGDLLTQTIRKLLQGEFGGSGVGFVPVASPVAKFRQTISTGVSEGWQDISFKTPGKPNLYISGHAFYGGASDYVSITDKSVKDSTTLIEKSILFGRCDSTTTINANNHITDIKGPAIFNRQVLSNDASHSLRISGLDNKLPVYGLSFESENGVIVDNFSFRGITGIELNKLDSNMLSAIAQNNHYDLIVFQYGVNMLFRPDDMNFNWYNRAFSPVVKKFKACFPDAEILMVSTADRAFRYEGQLESAHGIDSLVKVQASIAYGTKSSFYNQFATMGGRQSIVNWADSTPSLANKDYVHPNFRGAALLGQYFYEAMMKEYHQYTRTLR